jgi:hypothetical protein
MTPDKREQLELLKWFLIIVGPAMAIPGGLVFGVVEYVSGYLIFSPFLLACVVIAGNTSRMFRRFGARADLKSLDQLTYH